MRKADVVAILVSDIHLSERAPRARWEEPDWWEAMRRPLRELKAIAHRHNAPVICAGDIFHKWNSSAELINFALEELPTMFSVAGNHDSPYHDADQLHRSAYDTMRRAGRIIDVDRKRSPVESQGMGIILHGHGWGTELEESDRECTEENMIDVAVVHKYIWMKGKGYPNAPKEDLASRLKNKLAGYDVALFGDNHTQFLTKVGKCTVFNHGSFIRRTIDDGPPSVGLLHRDGKVTIEVLKCAKKDIVDTSPEAKALENVELISNFISSLRDSNESKFDYGLAIERFIREEQPRSGVVKALRKALEKAKDKK